MSFRRTRSAKLEEQTRSHAHFTQTESSLASVSTNQSYASRKEHKLTHFLSYLGARNPLPATIVADDVVWLMDNVAVRGPGGKWEAEFVAAVFDQKPSGKVVDIVGDIASKVGLAKGAREEKTIERRIGPFVMEILPGRQVKVNFNGSAPLKLGPGGRNGISSDIRRVPKFPGGSIVRSTAEVPMGVMGLLEMKTVFAEPEGWAVISGKPTASLAGPQLADRDIFLQTSMIQSRSRKQVTLLESSGRRLWWVLTVCSRPSSWLYVLLTDLLLLSLSQLQFQACQSFIPTSSVCLLRWHPSSTSLLPRTICILFSEASGMLTIHMGN